MKGLMRARQTHYTELDPNHLITFIVLRQRLNKIPSVTPTFHLPASASYKYVSTPHSSFLVFV